LLASLFIGYQRANLNAPVNSPPERDGVARTTQRISSIDEFILDGFPDGRPTGDNTAVAEAVAATQIAAAQAAAALVSGAQVANARAIDARAAADQAAADTQAAKGAKARADAQAAEQAAEQAATEARVTANVLARAAQDAVTHAADAQATAAPVYPPVANFAECQSQTTDPEYDGLAQDRGLAPAKGPGNQFLTDTLEAIARDPGRYELLLHWQFGGRSFPVTKAIRIPYRPSPQNPPFELSLFIGFQGPPTVR
jgi:hypothetical protein